MSPNPKRLNDTLRIYNPTTEEEFEAEVDENNRLHISCATSETDLGRTVELTRAGALALDAFLTDYLDVVGR